MAELQASYLRFAVPTASWEANVVFESADCACFACRNRSLSQHPPFPPPLPPSHHQHGKKGHWNELSARAKENGYQRGAHRDKDSLRDQNKHVDKAKKDQNGALDREVL
jgi:hypothetical protein